MSELKFSNKEAIDHGWAMTKKYFKTILLLSFIYIFFSIINGVFGHLAGTGLMPKNDLNALYPDKIQAERLYQHFQATGYVDQYGKVKEKLQEAKLSGDLVLPPEFENDRERIYIFLNTYRYRLPFPKIIFYGITFFLWLLTNVMGIGFLKSFLMISRDQKPSPNELFANWNILIPYFLGGVCYGLAVLGGFILLIIPGIILMFMLQMYAYLIIDKRMGPIESLKRSRVITKGSRGQLAVLGLWLLLLNIGGFLCLLVGLFFTISVSSVAMAYAYDQLESKAG